ncbi:MAG: type II secretion system minor pseudopilin GspI [Gammaproteobacteria bacterium]|nr:type II secretion system minor pseudopilin GspI [Gammaproteobacteria bacterium]
MKRGFTLLEVLVALAIVALGLSAAFAATGQAARTAEQLRVRTLAQWAAADALTALRLTEGLPRGRARRQEEIGGRIWWVEYRVRQSAAETLRDVEVRVGLERDAPVVAAARGVVRVRVEAEEEE